MEWIQFPQIRETVGAIQPNEASIEVFTIVLASHYFQELVKLHLFPDHSQG